MKTIARLEEWLFHPPIEGPTATLLLRLMAGGVFVSEGIMKFVFPSLGVGRFTKLGFPLPHLTASLVGAWEIVGGGLLIAGLLTRGAAILFAIEMIVALLSTKIGLYLGTSPLALPPAPPQVGLWAVLHESRSEYAQLLTSLYLVIAGPGLRSLDARRRSTRARAAREPAHPALRGPHAWTRVEVSHASPDPE
jgi:putative oxidoreductase